MSNARFFFLAGMLLVSITMGIALRGHEASKVAVEHFDEGVYASNLFIGPPEFRYPFQYLYAPPLIPSLFEWLLIFSGMKPSILITFNILLGVLLAFVIGWTANELLRADEDEHLVNGVSRDTWCIGAVIAMVIAITSEILIQYSRTALTDIPLTLALTLAVGTGGRGLRRNDWRWIVVAGVVTSIAWWTKYNGWLPIAILGAGVLGWFVFEKRNWNLVQPSVLKWLAVAAIAFTLWLPCLQGLQKTGGYAAVASNHAGYVVGVLGWMDSVQRHLEVDRFYTGWLTAAGLLAGIWMQFVWWIPTRRGDLPAANSRNSAVIVFLGLVVGGACWWLGSIPVLAFLSLTGVILTIASREEASHESRGKRATSTLGLWILLAWILGLLVATPMYRPYPRLILPLMVGLMIGAGYGLEQIVRRIIQPAAAPATPRIRLFRTSIGLALGMVAVAFILVPLRFTSPVAMETRMQFPEIANQVMAAVRTDLGERPATSRGDVEGLIAVYGEPGLFFHLARPRRETSRFVVHPIGTADPLLAGGQGTARSSSVPTYLITGPHAKDAVKELEGRPDRARLVATFEYHPSHLVLLDDFSPVDSQNRPPERIQVWTQQR